MPEVTSSRPPIPHLFMVLATGIFAVMAVSAFAASAGRDLAGSPEDGTVPAVDTLATGSLVAFVMLLAVTITAGRAGRHGTGRPVLGLASGLLAGVAAATSLFGFGVIPLGSPMWVWVPLVLSTLGTALGLTAPFPRLSTAPPVVATYPVVTSRSA